MPRARHAGPGRGPDGSLLVNPDRPSSNRSPGPPRTTRTKFWVRTIRSREEPDLIHFEPAGRRLTAARFFDSPGYPHVCVSWRGPAGGCSPHVVLEEGLFPQWSGSDGADVSVALAPRCRVAGPLRKQSARTKPHVGVTMGIESPAGARGCRCSAVA